MIFAFAIPLLGGLLSELFQRLALHFSVEEFPTGSLDAGLALIGGGIIWLTLASIFMGALEIYGTTNHLVKFAFLAGLIQLTFGLVLGIFSIITLRRRRFAQKSRQHRN